jgi:hypothetical protein
MKAIQRAATASGAQPEDPPRHACARGHTRSGRSFVEHHGHRPVVLDPDAHARTERPRSHTDAVGPKCRAERYVERLRISRPRSRREARAVALPGI